MFKARRIGLRTSHLEFPTVRGVRIRILERPGLWMAPERRDELLDELRTVAARSTPDGPLDYGVLSGSKERWDRCVLTLLRDERTGRLVGFSAMSFLDVRVGGRLEKVLHLGLLMMDPSFTGRGFSRLVYAMSLVLVLARRGGRSFWVSNVSQVPAVIGMVAGALDSVHPAPGTAPTSDHLQLARGIMARHRSVFGVGDEAGFDKERFVITNAYTGGSDHLMKTWHEAPRHRSSEINEWCRERLDYERGDDVLQLARFTPAVAFRCLRRFLSRSSRFAPVFGSARRLVGGGA